MLYSTVTTAAPALAELIGTGPRRILIISHVNPDGDAIGSLIGLGLALESRGHHVNLLTPTAAPPFVANMPALERVQFYSMDPTLPPDIDLVLLVDTGDMRRIGQVWETAREYILARPIAVIDHHVTNTGEGIVNFVDPSRSSTSEMI